MICFLSKNSDSSVHAELLGVEISRQYLAATISVVSVHYTAMGEHDGGKLE